jgi:hypothetical protein
VNVSSLICDLAHASGLIDFVRSPYYLIRSPDKVT